MGKSSESEKERPGWVWVSPLAPVAVVAILVLVVLWFFRPIRFVVLGFLAASALASALRPLRDYIPGPRGFRAIVCGILPIVVAAALLTLLSLVLANRFQRELAVWPETRQHINDWLSRVSTRLDVAKPLTVEGLTLASIRYVAGGGAALATESANIVSNVLIALAFLFFGNIYLLLSDHSALLHPLLRAFPPHRRYQLAAAVHDLEPRLRWWTIGAGLSMLIIGTATGIGYTLIGLQMALPLALLAGLSEIVPTLGPLFAFVVAILFAATQSPTMAIAVAILYLGIQLLESYIVHPIIMKKAVRMPPVVTLFTLVLWGKILGAGGLLLALPINLTIISFADRLLRRHD